MRFPTLKLDTLFTLYVGLGMLLFSAVAGVFTYHLTFYQAIAAANRVNTQLVRTVQTQAEVAVFAANKEIAEGVINGLLANSVIQGVRITGVNGFNQYHGPSGDDEYKHGSSFPLFRPIGSKLSKSPIGELILVRNQVAIHQEARDQSLQQTAQLLLQMLLANILLFTLTRHLVSKPVIRLARQMGEYVPGKHIHIQVDSRHADDELGQMANSANQMITSAELAITEVNILATTDPLTGLPNRRYFMERMQDEFNRVHRFKDTFASVLMLDLDHFKNVNDQYGHAGGDALLRQVAAIFRAKVRKVDTPGRLGGEEFAILLSGVRSEKALVFAERVRQEIASLVVESEAGPIRATVSIGITDFLPEDANPEAVLHRADQALYRAKVSGRNRVEIAVLGQSPLDPSGSEVLAHR